MAKGISRFQRWLPIVIACANRIGIFKKYIYLMREDTGAPSSCDATELFNWRVDQLSYADANSLDFVFDGRPISYTSTPRSEQDVIALFHELVGVGFFKGYKFIGTSQNDKYDSCFRTAYNGGNEFAYDANKTPLGVGSAHLNQRLSAPLVLEFKYDLDGLIADFEKEVKYDSEIDLVVCWEIGRAFEERCRIKSLLLGEEGCYRQYFGSTHALSYERQKRFEIIAIRDIIDYAGQPESRNGRS